MGTGLQLGPDDANQNGGVGRSKEAIRAGTMRRRRYVHAMSSDTAAPTVDDLRARLVGGIVVVEPLAAGHEAGLFEAAGDEAIFAWMPEDLRASREGLQRWLQWSLDAARSGRDVPF